jgi:hypothetical protein
MRLPCALGEPTLAGGDRADEGRRVFVIISRVGSEFWARELAEPKGVTLTERGTVCTSLGYDHAVIVLITPVSLGR